MIHNTQSAKQSVQMSQGGRNIHVIMKTMCPPGHHHNDFVATHALGHMMQSYTLLLPMNQRLLNRPSKECNCTSF